MFRLKLIDLPELVSETKSNGRFYTTPEGNVYPSVTTVLSATKDQTYLLEWKKRLGEAKANQESKRASDRGSTFYMRKIYLKSRNRFEKRNAYSCAIIFSNKASIT
jgi:hypothetical protein